MRTSASQNIINVNRKPIEKQYNFQTYSTQVKPTSDSKQYSKPTISKILLQDAQLRMPSSNDNPISIKMTTVSMSTQEKTQQGQQHENSSKEQLPLSKELVKHIRRTSNADQDDKIKNQTQPTGQNNAISQLALDVLKSQTQQTSQQGQTNQKEQQLEKQKSKNQSAVGYSSSMSPQKQNLIVVNNSQQKQTSSPSFKIPNHQRTAANNNYLGSLINSTDMSAIPSSSSVPPKNIFLSLSAFKSPLGGKSQEECDLTAQFFQQQESNRLQNRMISKEQTSLSTKKKDDIQVKQETTLNKQIEITQKQQSSIPISDHSQPKTQPNCSVVGQSSHLNKGSAYQSQSSLQLIWKMMDQKNFSKLEVPEENPDRCMLLMECNNRESMQNNNCEGSETLMSARCIQRERNTSKDITGVPQTQEQSIRNQNIKNSPEGKEEQKRHKSPRISQDSLLKSLEQRKNHTFAQNGQKCMIFTKENQQHKDENCAQHQQSTKEFSNRETGCFSKIDFITETDNIPSQTSQDRFRESDVVSQNEQHNNQKVISQLHQQQKISYSQPQIDTNNEISVTLSQGHLDVNGKNEENKLTFGKNQSQFLRNEMKLIQNGHQVDSQDQLQLKSYETSLPQSPNNSGKNGINHVQGQMSYNQINNIENIQSNVNTKQFSIEKGAILSNSNENILSQSKIQALRTSNIVGSSMQTLAGYIQEAAQNKHSPYQLSPSQQKCIPQSNIHNKSIQKDLSHVEKQGKINSQLQERRHSGQHLQLSKEGICKKDRNWLDYSTFERNNLWLKLKSQNRSQLKQQFSQQELSECTFKPALIARVSSSRINSTTLQSSQNSVGNKLINSNNNLQSDQIIDHNFTEQQTYSNNILNQQIKKAQIQKTANFSATKHLKNSLNLQDNSMSPCLVSSVQYGSCQQSNSLHYELKNAVSYQQINTLKKKNSSYIGCPNKVPRRQGVRPSSSLLIQK